MVLSVHEHAGSFPDVRLRPSRPVLALSLAPEARHPRFVAVNQGYSAGIEG